MKSRSAHSFRAEDAVACCGPKRPAERGQTGVVQPRSVGRGKIHASIDHDILLAILERHVPDGRALNLLRQYVRRTIYDGGLYEDVERGISPGCPLSPLMGAFYLKLLDERTEETGLPYARFMDDWVILAPTRWKLRAAIRLVNQTLAELKVEQHPDKTFIGRVSRGFDFPGYLFTPAGLAGGRPAGGRSLRETRVPAL